MFVLIKQQLPSGGTFANCIVTAQDDGLLLGGFFRDLNLLPRPPRCGLGRVRFYKQDENQLEFTGENVIDHTPQDELVKIYTGNAFDLVGERHQTNFKLDNGQHWADETYEIKLRNHKKEPVEIRVVEHLYRWNNWAITQQSDPFVKTDAQEIEFRIPLKPDEERSVTYTVHYSW